MKHVSILSLYKPAMSRAINAGGWLKGTTVRKGGSTVTNTTRSNTPQVQSTSATIFGGGVKDASGRTSEYFVSPTRMRPSVATFLRQAPWQSMDDQCPVCKSDRYLNPKLRLLVSACYHKMYLHCAHLSAFHNSTPPHLGVNRASIGYSPSDLLRVRYVRRSSGS